MINGAQGPQAPACSSSRRQDCHRSSQSCPVRHSTSLVCTIAEHNQALSIIDFPNMAVSKRTTQCWLGLPNKLHMPAAYPLLCSDRWSSLSVLILSLALSVALGQVSKPYVSDMEHKKLAGANKFLESDIVRSSTQPNPFAAALSQTAFPLSLFTILVAAWSGISSAQTPAPSTRTPCAREPPSTPTK